MIKPVTIPSRDGQPGKLSAVLLITGYVVYAFVLYEWLFQVTKLSFMSSFEPVERVSSLLISPLPILVLTMFLVVGLGGLSRVVRLPWSVSMLVPAFLLGTLLLILADNYLYTMRKWGVVASSGIFRWLLLAVYAFILHRAYLICARSEAWLSPKRIRLASWPLAVLILSSVAAAGFVLGTTDWRYANIDVTHTRPATRPNIIFLGADGLDTRYMSVYGFGLETTPFLERLASQSLVFADAHADSYMSTASTTSMLTGKHVYNLEQHFASQALTKRQAFQHFPGLLRELGYRGYQRGIAYYVDSAHLNLQRSFDYVNGRRLYNPDSAIAKDLAYVFNAEWLFLSSLWSGIKDRVLHLLGIVEMVNPVILIDHQYDTEGWEADRRTIEEAKAFVARQDQPFFMHIHLMSTHCCEFYGARSKRYTPEDIKEASAASDEERQMQARYLNAIRDADALFEDFIGWLQSQGKLENSILVINSDHSQNRDLAQAVPLLIRFPNAEYKGWRTERLTLVRVVPTLLDYMGINPPAWVDGLSLLGEPQTE